MSAGDVEGEAAEDSDEPVQVTEAVVAKDDVAEVEKKAADLTV